MKQTDILVIGAGPVGLFTVFEAGLLGLHCEIIDNLDRPGGQCTELYPEKPIYDIPGVPFQTGQQHVNALLEQVKPFDYGLHLSQRVDEIKEVSTADEGSNQWQVTTTDGQIFQSPNVFIAAGAGSFEPRKPVEIENPDQWQGNGLEYAVRDRTKYQQKNVFVFGGGDSALDWTVDLAPQTESLTLVHRRDAFRGAPHTEQQMRQMVADGTVELKTPYQIAGIKGQSKVESVLLKNFDTKEIEEHACDEILFLFGLHKKLGPILDWSLEIQDKKIAVDTEKFMTNKEGIFAVGDINHYPGKLDLILSGFHETTLACQEAFRRCYPGERVPFGYTTSNTKLQKKLGVQ